MRSYDEIKNAFSGLVASVYLPFHKNGEINYNSLRNFLDFVIDAGSKAVILTHGDSLYTLLIDQEITEVIKVTCQHVAGRAIVVAADNIWPIDKEIEFARYVKGVGADILMLLPPN